MKSRWVAGCLGLGLVANGCGTKVCTDIGCGDSVWAEFATPVTEDGDYTLAVATALGFVECVFTLGASAAGGEGGAGASSGEIVCEADEDLGFSVTRSDAGVLSFRLNPSASEDLTQIEVQFGRNGTILLEETYPLVYEELRPNGEDCEPACRVAEVTIE